MKRHVTRYRCFHDRGYMRGASFFITIATAPHLSAFGKIANGTVEFSPLGEKAKDSLGIGRGARLDINVEIIEITTACEVGLALYWKADGAHVVASNWSCSGVCSASLKKDALCLKNTRSLYK